MSDNFSEYLSCSARMENTRLLSDLKGKHITDEKVKLVNGLKTNNTYRDFLLSNSERIMTQTFDYMDSFSCRHKQSCSLNDPIRTSHNQMIEQRKRYEASQRDPSQTFC